MTNVQLATMQDLDAYVLKKDIGTIGGGGGGTGDVTTAQLNQVKTDLAATQAQQTALTTVTPTIDELVQTVLIVGWTGNATPSSQESVSSTHTVWIAPFPCKIVAATISFDYWSFPTSETDYWVFDFTRMRAGVTATISSKSTKTSTSASEAITARRPWRFNAVPWDVNNGTLAEGDLLTWRSTKTGAAASVQWPVTIVFRYVPL